MHSTDNLDPEAETPVLEFRAVTVPPLSSRGIALRDISLRVPAGQTALIRLEDGNESAPIADAAEGLVTPTKGAVLFRGGDWAVSGTRDQARMRGLIGRVFPRHGWVSNLNVTENITLSQRHHTHRQAKDILKEADSLARRFGMTGLPRTRPAWLHPRDLKRAQWVRAFIGDPALIIMEQPELDAPIASVELLAQAARDAMERGAALLWTTVSTHIWNERILSGATRYVMRGETVDAEGSRG